MRMGTQLDADSVLLTEAGTLRLVRTGLDLEELLGVRVDLIPRGGLRPRVAAEVQDEVTPL